MGLGPRARALSLDIGRFVMRFTYFMKATKSRTKIPSIFPVVARLYQITTFCEGTPNSRGKGIPNYGPIPNTHA